MNKWKPILFKTTALEMIAKNFNDMNMKFYHVFPFFNFSFEYFYFFLFLNKYLSNYFFFFNESNEEARRFLLRRIILFKETMTRHNKNLRYIFFSFYHHFTQFYSNLDRKVLWSFLHKKS